MMSEVKNRSGTESLFKCSNMNVCCAHGCLDGGSRLISDDYEKIDVVASQYNTCKQRSCCDKDVVA